MSEQPFGALTRQTAAAISRRRSLLALGGAGAALAALASPAVSAAKNTKKDPNKKCKQQAARCKSSWEEICEELNCEPAGLADLLECCAFLKTCAIAEYNPCVLATLL